VKHEIHHRSRTALRRDERTVARPGERYHQARVDSEIPSWCAFTAVAPIVRFKAFEIFATPTFFLASDFISRSSDEVHARRIAFFLVGILSSLFRRARLLSHEVQLAMRQLSRFSGATLLRQALRSEIVESAFF
jgi:hypothetical protein